MSTDLVDPKVALTIPEDQLPQPIVPPHAPDDDPTAIFPPWVGRFWWIGAIAAAATAGAVYAARRGKVKINPMDYEPPKDVIDV